MTQLQVEANRTVVTGASSPQGDAAVHSLPIGFLWPGLALQHQPPTAVELEGAIEAIEDAVMPLARVLPPGTQLVTADPLAKRLVAVAGHPGTLHDECHGDVLEISEVEALFNELADIAQGRPAAASPFMDSALCGYLLILREVMHHLAFSTVAVRAT